ncbi:MAG: SPASM domain-containing protein [Candidatus Omnitrophica bacterium]|nr:SPASM domain-containing protein [Candidatus Omnitrophota bacterium]
MALSGLGCINVELTSRCNKKCWICGRRKVDKDYPELALKYGDMDFALVKKIAAQLPPNIVVQFHKDGEALLYPRFGDAVKLFPNQIKNIVTNGKLIVDKADEIIDNLDTLSISVFENDEEEDEQFELIKKFLKIKGARKPYTSLRLIGDVDSTKYKPLGCLIIRRVLHAKMGSFNYKKRDPTIPEIGICWDFLHHLCVSREGKVSICVRFDPKSLGVIGDLNSETLDEIWNGPKRMEWIGCHKEGRRDKIPLCSYCQFWGVPTSSDHDNTDTKRTVL